MGRRILFVVIAIPAALLLAIRVFGEIRLALANADFEAAFTSEELDRVRRAPSGVPTIARRLLAAAQESVGPCRARLRALDEVRRSTTAGATPGSLEAPASGTWQLLPAIPVIKKVGECGQTALAHGDQPLALTAVELLGAFATSLEARPDHASFISGVEAEFRQLALIDELRKRPLAPEARARLQAALPTQDLRKIHRQMLISEALDAKRMAYGHLPPGVVDPGWAVTVVLGPLAASNHVAELARVVRPEQAPSLVSSLLAKLFGGGGGYRRQALALQRIIAQREAQRLALAT